MDTSELAQGGAEVVNPPVASLLHGLTDQPKTFPNSVLPAREDCTILFHHTSLWLQFLKRMLSWVRRNCLSNVRFGRKFVHLPVSLLAWALGICMLNHPKTPQGRHLNPCTDGPPEVGEDSEVPRSQAARSLRVREAELLLSHCTHSHHNPFCSPPLGLSAIQVGKL